MTPVLPIERIGDPDRALFWKPYDKFPLDPNAHARTSLKAANIKGK